MILILDTETTAVEKARVVEIAVGIIKDANNMDSISIIYDRFKPPEPITVKAMSVHGITNEQVENLGPFAESRIYNDLLDFNVEDNIVVAHNAKFDLGVLANEGIVNGMRVIDTYRCCKHIFKDRLDGELNLQYLKYYLGLYNEPIPDSIKEVANEKAHSAVGDVLTLYLMLRRMLAKYTLEDLLRMTREPILYNLMPFGKHKGKPIGEIVATERGYVNWAFKNIDDDDVLYTFKCATKGERK